MRIVVSEFLSQDGVIDPECGDGCDRWTARWHNREIDEHKTDELFAADALLVGRVTYQALAAVWPSMPDEDSFATRMNGIAKFVVSSTLKTVEWNNSHLLSGGVIDAVTALKRRPGRDLLVGGSATLVRALARHGLVDLYRFTVYPVVLGSGERLFDSQRVDLNLVGHRSTSTGVLLTTYQPVSAIEERVA